MTLLMQHIELKHAWITTIRLADALFLEISKAGLQCQILKRVLVLSVFVRF